MSSQIFSRLTAAPFQQPLYQSSVTAWQGHIPFAFWCIEQLRPKVFVELGSHLGDSYFSFCQAVREHSTATTCYAVDTWEGDAHTGPYNEQIYQSVTAHNQQHYEGFSHLLRMTFDDALDRLPDQGVDLLHIDGWHTYEAVKHDFETWLPKLSEQGVVLFHDSNVYDKDFGVWKFMRELEKVYPHFHFFHSFGLSLFTITEKAPEPALWLTKLGTADSDQWRQAFSRLGDCVAYRAQTYFQQLQLQHELKLRDAQIRTMTEPAPAKAGELAQLGADD